MMINKLSCLHLWDIIIPNCNTLRNTIPNIIHFGKKYSLNMTLSWKNNPELQKMTLVKPKGFDIGRIGFRPVYPGSNLIMCHLQEVDATRGYGCWI